MPPRASSPPFEGGTISSEIDWTSGLGAVTHLGGPIDQVLKLAGGQSAAGVGQGITLAGGLGATAADAGGPITLQTAAAGTGTTLTTRLTILATGAAQYAGLTADPVASAANTGNLIYNSTTQTFRVSLNGAAYTDLDTTAGDSLQTAYVAGPTIATTIAQGPVTIGNAVDTQTALQVNRTFVGVGTAIGVTMAAGATGAALNLVPGTGGFIRFGTADPFARNQIWHTGINSIFRMGADTADGDPADIDSEGIVVYHPTGDQLGRMKADRFALTRATDSSLNYFRVDQTSLFYRANPPGGAVHFFVDRTTGFVGVGTATPTKNLDVVGDLKVSGAIDPTSISFTGAAASIFINSVTSTAAASVAGEGRIRFVTGTGFQISSDGGAYATISTGAGTSPFVASGTNILTTSATYGTLILNDATTSAAVTRTIKAPNGTATANGSGLDIFSGNGGATSGNSGALFLSTGGTTDGNTGDVTIQSTSPAGTNRSSGSINLQTGTPTGTGTAGSIFLLTNGTTRLTIADAMATFSGNVTVSGKLTVTGAIDPPSLSLSGGTALYLESADGSTAAVAPVNQGRIRYLDGTGWQLSSSTGAYSTALTAASATLATVLAAGNTTGANNILVTAGQQIDSATAAALSLGATNATSLGIGTASGTTSTFQIFVNQGGASFSSNAGFQLSSTTSNRAAMRVNQFGANTGVPGFVGFKSRGTNVTDLASVADGDILARMTAIGVTGDNLNVPLAGFVDIRVPTGGTNATWVATDFSVSLVPLAGPINSNRQVSRITSEAAFELIDGTTAPVSPANKGQLRYNDTTKTFQVSMDTSAWASLATGTSPFTASGTNILTTSATYDTLILNDATTSAAVNRTVKAPDGTASVNGSHLFLRAGAGGATSGNGGSNNLIGGSSSDGDTGTVNIESPSAAGTNRNTGGIALSTGTPTGTGTAGSITLATNSVTRLTLTDAMATFSGNVTVSGKLTVTGAIDPPSLSLSGGTALYFESNDGSTAAVAPLNKGRIRYLDGTGWQVSSSTGAYSPVTTTASQVWTRSGTTLSPTTAGDTVSISHTAADATAGLAITMGASTTGSALTITNNGTAAGANGLVVTGNGGAAQSAVCFFSGVPFAAAVSGSTLPQVLVDDTTAGFAIGNGGGIAFTGRTPTLAFLAGVRAYKENGTTGNTAGALVFSTAANGAVNAERWRISSTGHLLPAATDNAEDIGGAATNRIRTLYAGTSVVVGNTITIASSAITGSANVTIDTGAAGTLNLGNANATTIVFGSGATTLTASGNVTVTGDLTVNGTTTTVNSVNLTVTDPLIYANNGGLDPSFAGFAWDQGAALDVILSWNPTNNRFEFGRFNTVGGTVLPGGALTTLTTVRANDLLLAGTAITADAGLTVTSTAATLALAATGANAITFATAGTGRARFTSAGNLTFDTDATNDVGAVGANRPNNVYVANSVVVGSSVTIGTASVTGSGALTVTATAAPLALAATGANAITFATAATTRMQVTSTGGLQLENGAGAAVSSTVTNSALRSNAGVLEVSNGGAAYVAVATGTTSPFTGTEPVLATSASTRTLYLSSASSIAGTNTYRLRAPDSSSAAGHGLTLQSGAPASGSAGGDILLRGADGVAGNSSGGSVTWQPGIGTGSAGGGSFAGQSGAGGDTGNGGSVLIYTGVGGGTSGASGPMDLATGTTTDGNTGAISVTTGTPLGTNRNSGGITLETGTPTGTGTSGSILLKTGNTTRLTLADAMATFSGDVTVSGKLTVTGAIDPPSLSLSGGTALFVDSADGSTAPVSAAGHGRMRFVAGTGWQFDNAGAGYSTVTTTASQVWTRSGIVLSPTTANDTVLVTHSAGNGVQATNSGAGVGLYCLSSGAGGRAILGSNSNASATLGAFYIESNSTAALGVAEFVYSGASAINAGPTITLENYFGNIARIRSGKENATPGNEATYFAIHTAQAGGATVSEVARFTSTLGFQLANGSTAAVSAASTSALRSNAGTLEVSNSTGAYSPVTTTASQLWTRTGIVLAPTTANDTLALSTAGSTLIANFNEATANASAAGGGQVIALASNGYAYLAVSGYGTTDPGCYLALRRSRGTIASPSQVLSGDVLGRVDFVGRENTGQFNGAKVYLQAVTTENWTSTANGSYMAFITTPTGTVAPTEAGRWTQSGALQLANNTTAAFSDANTVAFRSNAGVAEVSENTAAYAAIRSGTVAATVGGTGQTVYAVGDILYASTTTALSKLAVGTVGQVLTVAAGLPSWATNATSPFTASGTNILTTSATYDTLILNDATTSAVVTRTIKAPNGTASVAGSNLFLDAGDGGTTSGNGGLVSIRGGSATQGNGGSANVLGRDGVGTNRNGGNVVLDCGEATGTGEGGTVSITAGGGGTTGIAGTVAITGGTGGSTSGSSGGVSIASGTTTDGNTGQISVTTGTPLGTNRNSGAIAIQTGTPTGTGTSGSILLKTNLVTRLTLADAMATFSGNVTVSGKLTVTGAIDPPSLSLSGGTALYLESADGSTAAVAPVNQGRIRYLDGTGWQVSSSTGAYATIATGATTSPFVASGTNVLTTSSTYDTLILNDATTSAAVTRTIKAPDGTATAAGSNLTVVSGSGGTTSGASGALIIKTGATTDGTTGLLTILTSTPLGTNRSSGQVSISTGSATGSGSSGLIQLSVGAAGTTGIGGLISLVSGAGGSTSGNGGAIDIYTGGAVLGTSGALTLATGTTTDGNTGAVSLRSGDASGTARTSGSLAIATGAGGSVSGGSNALTLATGTTTDGDTGAISLTTPTPLGTNRSSGNITHATGTPTGTGTAGTHQFTVAGASQVKIGTTGITSYRNVTTAGWGVPAIYGSGRSTAQTAAVASVATYTVGAADGSFDVSANVNVTTSTTHSFTVTVAYTDETNTGQTLTLTFSSLAGTLITTITNVTGVGPYSAPALRIRCKASTSITVATAGTFTSVTYNVEATITQVS